MMAMSTEVNTSHGRSRDHRWTIEDNIFSIYWTILESSLNTFAVHRAHERNSFILVNYVVIYSDANI